MKLFLLLFVASSVSAVNHPNGNRAAHPYEFVRTGNSRVGDLGSKAPQFNRLKSAVPNGGDKVSFKKSSGVPPYAVLMEPLVKYSQPDPLYNDGKGSASEPKISNLKSDLKIKKEETKDEVKAEKQISSKSGISHFEDQEGEATGLFQKQQPPPQRLIALTGPGVYYDGPPPTPPEPIIEIIIKESNESLPTPPPIPTTTRKKKKEQVQVFYVKYKKDPTGHYGEDKIVYDAPVPAVTPPTNNADHHEEEQEEEYLHHQQQLYHHDEDVTLPPRPSTTLKAIIKPDSGVYHGSGGVRITFGGPHDEEGGYGFHHHHHHHHRGDFEEQSAPQPSVVLPPKKENSIVPRGKSESQLTKRNPAPFHSQTQPPQQTFNSGPSVTPPRDFHRPTPLPTFQQTPQFPAQPFKPQLPKAQPSQPPSSSSPPRPSPTRYSTLPQHLQQFPKPQQSFPFPPPRPQPSQPPVQQPIQQQTVQSQQYYSINQPHLKSSFHVRHSPPQQYQTISNQAAQQHSFPKAPPVSHNPPVPSFNQPPKPFPQPTHNFPQPSLSFPHSPSSFPQQSNSFSQVPQQVLGPIIQRSQSIPFTPQQNSFSNKPAFPPQQPQQHQPHQQHQQHQLHQQHQQHQQHQLHQQHQQHQQLQQQHHHHQQQVEQLNRLQQQQQRLQSQVRDQQQQQHFFNQQQFQTTYAPEIIRSISPELPFAPNHRFESQKTHVPVQTNRPTSRPQISHTVKPNIQFSVPKNVATTTESYKKYAKTTQPPVEYVTEDPKKAEEERRKKEEKKKQNVAALPAEVPDDLRQQLLSSGILGNADIQILDYDKIGDIPIESLPPEALANFQAVAGSEPVPSVVKPDSKREDIVAEASEQSSVVVAPPNAPSEVMEMKVVRYNPDSKEGSQVPNQYVKEGATQLEPVVLNDSKYNRYLPLKVAGAQFPVPDVPELRGKNVTSVVVLAPVDYEFLQRHEEVVDTRAGRRSSHPVLEVQGVHFVAGDVLKTLVKTPTSENYRKWLDRENRTSLEKQSVVLLVIEPSNNSTGSEKEIFMYDIGTQKVSKLSGELSAQFVEVAESNSENEDLEEISDSAGGDFTVKETSEVSPVHVRTQRKASDGKSRKSKSKVSPR